MTNSSAGNRPLRLLWQLMRGFRLRYILAITALLLSTAVGYLVPLIGSATIDYILSGQELEGSLPSHFIALMGGLDLVQSNLWIPALYMVLFTIIAGCFNFIKGRAAAQASDGIARRLKDRLYDHLQHLPGSYHDHTDTGDLIQRSTSDVETIRMALSSQVVEVFHAFLLLLTVIPIMLLLDARMTVASFVLTGPIILYGYFYFRRVKHLFREVDEAESAVTHVVQENLNGLRVVRAFTRQQYEIDKFAGPNKSYRDNSLKLVRLMALYWSSSDFVVLLQHGVVLFVGVYFISQDTLTIGTLFAFMMFLNILLWPVRMMGRILTDFGKSMVALSRVGEILAVQPESTGQDSLKPHTDLQGAVQVHNLHFGHTSGTAALNGISFDLKAGQTLAILGPSGAGKSTLMHLLLRLYDYSEGSIQLDGTELCELDRKWVRAQCSVVMQEPFLFSKTVGDNIRLGRRFAESSEITTAARLAHIHETISSFPAGYDTLVGERGITLSGGQRQRVALARALLRDTPILLLDDALSAVDADTEATILQALRTRRGRRTTIVIAHRLSTLAHADQVIVLEHGRIIQHGTHAELIQQEGLYRRLWHIQTPQSS